MRLSASVLGFCLAAALSACAGGPVEVAVDAACPVGVVKPVNGVGQPPMVDVACGAPMFRYLKEAGIPYSRLHDVGGAFGGHMWADIPNIFRNFDADENRAENYDFEATDHLVRELMKNGVEPFFRLGVTIENHGFKPKHIFPPKDFAKWARICEHVIRHYTEGWADGFRYRIAYWEIWNEPDGHQDVAQNCMWKDSFARYCDFYGVVAPYLKGKFPHLKIGGYASCGFYAGVGAAHVKAANSSPRMQYFVTCAKEFLDRARKGNWPLDYFSYHSYSEVPGVLEQVDYADRLLTEYGFTRDRCERVFNEWLPRVSRANLGSAFQASAIAAELAGLQNGPCDLACIYDARCAPSSYAPLFNPFTLKPHKAYYAFTAFNELRKLKTAVKAEVKGGPVYACAAADGGRIAILVANPTRESLPCHLSVPGFVLKSYRLTDDTRTDQEQAGVPQELPPYSFAVVLGERRAARVDAAGVLRGTDDGSEVAAWGVNYYAPFALDYRALKAKGADPKAVIREDLAQFRRLGLDCIRLHCFDRQISQRDGALADTVHLELLDYLVAEAAKQGLQTVLTPIAWFGWDHLTPVDQAGFSNLAPMDAFTSRPDLRGSLLATRLEFAPQAARTGFEISVVRIE